MNYMINQKFKKPKHLDLIIWLLTSRCNLSCKHCYASRFNRYKELTEEEALKLVEDASKIPTKHISFTGGEVFMRKDVMNILRYAAELGIETSVVTNGLLITKEIARELAQYSTFVYLSIDGAEKETHESIRGKGTWEKVLLASHELHKHGVKFATIMCVNRKNLFEIKKYIDLADKIGASGTCFIPLIPSGKASRKEILSPWEMMNFLEKIEKIASKIHFPISLWCIPFAGLIVKSAYIFPCRNYEEEIDIDPSGNVLLCDVLDIKLSNVKDGIEKGWREQKENPLARSLFNPSLSEPCNNCELKNECRGGCYARALFLSHNIYNPDPLCPKVAGLI